MQLSEQLGLDTLAAQIAALPRQDQWDSMARSALRDDLQQAHTDLTVQALATVTDTDDAKEVLHTWCTTRPAVAEARRTVASVRDHDPDLARLSVALRAVRSLIGSPV